MLAVRSTVTIEASRLVHVSLLREVDAPSHVHLSQSDVAQLADDSDAIWGENGQHAQQNQVLRRFELVLAAGGGILHDPVVFLLAALPALLALFPAHKVLRSRLVHAVLPGLMSTAKSGMLCAAMFRTPGLQPGSED